MRRPGPGALPLVLTLAALTLAWLAAAGPGLAQPRPAARREPRQEPRQESRQDAGADQAYALGRGGWAVERFGGSVAVLRAAVTPASTAAGAPGGAGLLVLSCEGPERRLSLTLPEPLRDPGPGAAGTGPVRLLLRPSPPGPGRDAFLVARARLTGGRSLALAAGEGAGVPALARMLRAAPARLDLVVAAGPPRPGALAVAVLHPSVGRGDLAAFDDFLRACGEG